MATTKLSNLINPQVLADMVSAGVVKSLKFSNLATIDTSLKGKAGDTLTLPKYAYIGDATDVGEAQPIDIAMLSTTSIEVGIKKAGKGVEITDEALLSGYGDPMGEAEKQLNKAIVQKVDNDCFVALATAPLTVDVSANSKLTPDVVADADIKFGEEIDEKGVLLIAPEQLAELRKDPNFLKASEIGQEMLMKGTVGAIHGHQIVLSNKIVAVGGKYTNYLVKKDALAILLKRDVEVETDRDIITKTNVIVVDKHYGVYLKDDTKIVKIVVQA